MNKKKYKIKEAVVVEGVYDKIRLSGFIDGLILTTHGFAVYSNPDFAKTFARLAKDTGIVILTDSDSAGLRIRNFIKQKAEGGRVLHAYVPDIPGTERRKRKPSAEGLLGVEGMTEELIISALRAAGCTIDDRAEAPKSGCITKADFCRLGLSGAAGSRALREKLAAALGLPAKLSANMLLDVLNRITDSDALERTLEGLADD